MLTRECRPQVFEDVAGQELTKRVLKAVIADPAEAPKSIILQGPFGCGKCIPGNCRIATPFGYIPIKDYCNQLVYGNVRYGFTDVAENKSQVLGEDCVRSVQKIFRESHAYVKNLILENGEVISGTLEHMVRVYSQDGGFKWKALRDCHVDDYILRNNRPLLYGSYTKTTDFDVMIDCIIAGGYAGNKTRFEQILNSHPDNRITFYQGLFRWYDFKKRVLKVGQSSVEWLQALCQSLGVLPVISPDKETIVIPRIKKFEYNQSFDEKVGCHCYGKPLEQYLVRDVRVCQSDFEYCYVHGFVSFNEARAIGKKNGVYVNYNPIRIVGEYADFADVYDVSQIEFHDFYAQGVINHNTTQARILAKGLNCTGGGTKPCGHCENCKKDLESSGFYEEYDSAVIGQIEKIRELRDSFYVNNAGYKVVVLDEAHLCSKQAQSAFLKVLEEAPKSVFFLFCTTEADKILPTIRSRSLELELELVPETQVLESLVKICKQYDLHFSDEALNLVVAGAHGHMRNAHMLLDKLAMVGEEDFRKSLRSSSDAIYRYFESVAQKNNTTCFQAIGEILSFPVSEVGTTFTNEVRLLTRAMVGQENRYSALVKVLGQDCLKLVKLCVSEWVTSSLGSDPTIEVALLCIFNLMMGSKTQTASAPAQANRFSRR